MLQLAHILGLKDRSRSEIEQILDMAEACDPIARREARWRVLSERVLATLFYEPSTRTRLSFETAMLRLGGEVISVADALRTSSAWKGETLGDAIRTMDSYADVIALRHSESGAAAEAAAFSRVPIINAGDGMNEHPTQGLLDLLTIRRSKGRIDGLNVVLVGDLKHTRSTNSLSYGLSRFDVHLTLVSPKGFEPTDEIQTTLRERQIDFELSGDLTAAVRNADVIYVCRIQKERLEDPKAAEAILGSYIVNRALLGRSTREPIVMHHLPRVGELAEDVDDYPGARYFEQPWSGVLVRMALLAILLAPAEAQERLSARAAAK